MVGVSGGPAAGASMQCQGSADACLEQIWPNSGQVCVNCDVPWPQSNIVMSSHVPHPLALTDVLSTGESTWVGIHYPASAQVVMALSHATVLVGELEPRTFKNDPLGAMHSLVDGSLRWLLEWGGSDDFDGSDSKDSSASFRKAAPTDVIISNEGQVEGKRLVVVEGNLSLPRAGDTPLEVGAGMAVSMDANGQLGPVEPLTARDRQLIQQLTLSSLAETAEAGGNTPGKGQGPDSSGTSSSTHPRAGEPGDGTGPLLDFTETLRFSFTSFEFVY
jgi:hypothetical protein